jgi:tetratricopeptide (TPR) repeat protein
VPEIPGYADLREVGRGGAGVVYQAREMATGRDVALKVLRGGQLASPAERERFLAEVRAAASLRHDGIVKIFAVGAAGGLPYYAMEYLAGGSLADRLCGEPLPPRQAAAVVEAVARAVQHAHDCGVIHRDLKPANILLDGADLDSLKVSDFGTAKRSESMLLATPTEAILGTPSYMAPEQALGRSRDVGPAADVYALGAILYELLTGRPPFRGSSPYETLLQSLNHTPVSPRRLSPGVPIDLESVCLRCLEKDPNCRYPTAATLAEDLRAYREGRSVTSRPPSSAGRLARWARREPAVASLSALSLGLLFAGLIVATVLWLRADARAREASRRLRTTSEALRLYTQAANALFRQPAIVSRQERDALIRALEMYEILQGEVSIDPTEEYRTSYATLQLANGLQNLNEYEVAARVCRRAVDCLRRLALAHPDRDDFEHAYAEGCSQLGGTLAAAGSADEALQLRREAVRVGQRLVDRHPERDAYRGSLAAYWSVLATEYSERGDAASAEALFVRSLRVHRQLIARYRGDPPRYALFAGASFRYGEHLIRHGRGEEVGALVQERMELSERARREPDWPLIAGYLIRGDVVVELDRAGRHAEADRAMAYGLSAWRELATRRPSMPVASAMYRDWLELQRKRAQASDATAAAP